MKTTSRSLAVWDLPNLLGSVHRYRKASPKVRIERPHFKAILAFVHRNHFAVASQIQRRFGTQLRSTRTTRRHLTEMEAIGLLGVVNTSNAGPLWPKVYFVTRRGVTRLRQALHEQGQEWTDSVRDRRRSDGTSAQHVLHELFLTEFLLLAWQTTAAKDDLQILTTQRRSLAKHPAFGVLIAGRKTRLEPDAMFLYQQDGKGMMCCFVEMDLDSMTPRQMETKFRRYQIWAESANGTSFLKGLYQRNGATNPTTAFRILLIVGGQNRQTERRRVASLLNVIKQLPPSFGNRAWITTVQQLRSIAGQSALLSGPLWIRPRDAQQSGEAKTASISQLPLHGLW